MVEEYLKKMEEEDRKRAKELGIDYDELDAALTIGMVNSDRSRGISPRPPLRVYVERNKETGKERTIVLK
jgi:hypothetical protein